MSKIGKAPVIIPEGVTVTIEGQTVNVVGPKGNLTRKFSREVSFEVKEGQVLVSCKKETKVAKSIFGTTRALINNMVYGVSQGWVRELELVGTGYRAEVSGEKLILTVGFSHPVEIPAPAGISFKVEKTIITVSGTDKELVGQVAADIRGVKPPEPYQGKGIKYRDEIVRRKAGKAAKTVGAA
jgi:large subunit ribosomal protein L6